MNAKQKKDIKKILDHYGERAQTLQCVEELNECSVELMKAYKVKANNAIEEIADALIMLEQMKHVFGVHTIDRFIDHKIKRTLKRIEDASSGS